MEQRKTTEGFHSLGAAAALIFLCLLAASRWLLEGARPEVASSSLSEAIGALAAAVILAGAGSFRGAFPVHWNSTWRVVPGIALVLCGPMLAQGIAGRRLGSDNATLALALVPVVVAVLRQTRGELQTADLPGDLWPGLAGLAGLLLLLPEPKLNDIRGWCGLLMLPMFVGGGAELAKSPDRASSGRRAWWCVAVGFLATAAVFAATAGLTMEQEGMKTVSLLAAGVDGALMMLTIFCLAQLAVQQWSAQFLLVPGLALLESIVLLRPALDVRSWCGLALVAAGALRLLWRRTAASAESTVLNLR